MRGEAGPEASAGSTVVEYARPSDVVEVSDAGPRDGRAWLMLP